MLYLLKNMEVYTKTLMCIMGNHKMVNFQLMLLQVL